MNGTGKIRIIVGDYGGDGAPANERVLVADAAVHVSACGTGSLLQLNLVLPSRDVNCVLDGMRQDGVEVSLEEVGLGAQPN